jgi:hypothetical protein
VHSCSYHNWWFIILACTIIVYESTMPQSIILLFYLKHCIPFVCLSSWWSALCIFFARHLQLLFQTTNFHFYQWRIKVDVIFLHNSRKKMQRAIGERMGKEKNKSDNTMNQTNIVPINAVTYATPSRQRQGNCKCFDTN